MGVWGQSSARVSLRGCKSFLVCFVIFLVNFILLLQLAKFTTAVILFFLFILQQLEKLCTKQTCCPVQIQESFPRCNDGTVSLLFPVCFKVNFPLSLCQCLIDSGPQRAERGVFFFSFTKNQLFFPPSESLTFTFQVFLKSNIERFYVWSAKSTKMTWKSFELVGKNVFFLFERLLESSSNIFLSQTVVSVQLKVAS